MSNNISINDFDNICRTCLSREDLKPLYEKNSGLTCLVDMLNSRTFVKFTEDDGLPMNICANCIHEIKQAFSFAKRCETTDTILRNCVLTQFDTEVANNSLQSQNVEAIIKIEDEWLKEIKPEIKFSNLRGTGEDEEVLGHYEYLEVKLEMEENLEYINDEDNDNLEEESYQDETNCDNIGSQIKEVDWKDDSLPLESRNKNLGKMKPKPLYYECSKCYEKFPDLQAVKQHRMEVNHPPNVPSPCPVCNKMIGCNKMNRHMRIHTGEKPYCCEICGIRFTQAGTLSLHQDTQHSKSNDRVYNCETCGKSFKRPDLLVAHQRREKKAILEKNLSKDFQCTECGQAFAKVEYLRSHKLIHTGEKLNVCAVCKKAFTHRTTLHRHMRLHTGEKPYPCKICGKEFRDSSNMKKHLQRHGK